MRARAGPAHGIDYQDVGEDAVPRSARRLHLSAPGSAGGPLHHRRQSQLILNNRENREEYRVLILPAGEGALGLAAAAKIKEFYDTGGKVIATASCPRNRPSSAKTKKCRAMADIFGVSPDGPLKADVKRAQDRKNFYVFWYYMKKNKPVGTAIFLPDTHPWLMDYALKLVLPQSRRGYSGADGRLPHREHDYDGRPDLHSQGEGRPRHLLLRQLISQARSIPALFCGDRKTLQDLESSYRIATGRGFQTMRF